LGTIVLTTCSNPTVLPPSDPGALPLSEIRHPPGVVVERAYVSGVKGGSSVQVRLDLRNLSTDTLLASSGECFARLRAFATASLEEPAIWDDHSDRNVGCPAILIEVTIPPGEVRQLVREYSTRIVAAWPPPRAAHLGVVIIANGSRAVLPAS